MVYKRLERFLIQLDNVDSTNAYAINLLRTGSVVNGTVVLAHHQHNGRGQRSNTWTTEPGKNLTCSIILLPDLPAKDSFYLNVVTALAIRKSLEDLGLNAKIKWPNDILIGEKKVCGILIENQISGDKISNSVVGIGLNVNQDNFTHLPQGTSIKRALNNAVEIQDVFDQVYGYLDFYYNLLCESNFELLLKHYYQHLYLLGIPSRFKDELGEFEGVILGIDDFGRLLVQRGSEKKSYQIKEIAYCY